MNQQIVHNTAARHAKTFSRRRTLIGGAIAGVSGALELSAIATRPSLATAANDTANDAVILNGALDYEHQAIWAYGFAASRLSDTEAGCTVKALALCNQADHIAYRDALVAALRSLNAMPVMAEQGYDVSAYINAGEGNLDSDVNIAKLALALETDAAIAYTQEIAKLKAPALITAAASIGTDDAAHATAIRAVFISLGVDIPHVPASFISLDARDSWVLKV